MKFKLKFNDFINELNNTSNHFDNLSEYIYLKVFGLYKILYASIQNKYEIINNNRKLEIKPLGIRKIDNIVMDIMKKDFSKLLKELNSQIKSEGKKYISKILQKINNKLQKKSKKLYRWKIS